MVYTQKEQIIAMGLLRKLYKNNCLTSDSKWSNENSEIGQEVTPIPPKKREGMSLAKKNRDKVVHVFASITRCFFF